MHPALTAKLREAYPLLMHQRPGCSFVSFGIECRPGWYAIVHELFGLLDDVQQRTGKSVQISQVKEKYGTLRFNAQTSMGYAEEDMLEQVVEHVSSITCAVCGLSGKINPEDDYLKARCFLHRNNVSPEEFDQACNRFLDYERQGLSTKDLVYVDAKRSAVDDQVCEMRLHHFPDRLVSLRDKPLMEHLVIEQVSGTSGQMLSVIQGLEFRGSVVIGSTDGSHVAEFSFGHETLGAI